jgi:hypothetical protein
MMGPFIGLELTKLPCFGCVTGRLVRRRVGVAASPHVALAAVHSAPARFAHDE